MAASRTAAPLYRDRSNGLDTPSAAHPRQAEIERLDRLADLLDSRFRIPVIDVRFGLDAILGLIPGVGDFAALLPTAYMIWEGRKMGASNGVIGRMTVNAGLDFVVGSIPVLGSIWDIWFKANRRNMALLRDEIARPPMGTARTPER